jgi:hypothetical protein
MQTRHINGNHIHIVQRRHEERNWHKSTSIRTFPPFRRIGLHSGHLGFIFLPCLPKPIQNNVVRLIRISSQLISYYIQNSCAQAE